VTHCRSQEIFIVETRLLRQAQQPLASLLHKVIEV